MIGSGRRPVCRRPTRDRSRAMGAGFAHMIQTCPDRLTKPNEISHMPFGLPGPKLQARHKDQLREMKILLTEKESGELHDTQLSGENAIDLLLGATLGAYFGSSIDHSKFDVTQAGVVLFFLVALWMFVFAVKIACRALIRKYYAYAALFLILTVSFTFVVKAVLAMGGITNVLFFQTVMFGWVVSYIMAAIIDVTPKLYARAK